MLLCGAFALYILCANQFCRKLCVVDFTGEFCNVKLDGERNERRGLCPETGSRREKNENSNVLPLLCAAIFLSV